VFFFALTVICLALVPATPPEFRWVNYAMIGLAGFWAVMMAIESLTRGRGERGAGL
jgi:uncharacterized membrane protein YuzA (DUF378 family)